MSGTPYTPIGGPRLVSKLCVVGEATEEEGNGASFLLFCKVNVPHSISAQSYPLFPDDHLQLRSSTLAPLTPSGSLSLSPSPTPLILEASKRLRIPTSSSISSSSSTSRPPEVNIRIQDFAVSLVVEGSGGEAGGPGSYGRASPQRMGSSGSGRRSSFSPVLGGDQESTVYIVVLEVAIPCSTVPPLDCYSISLPLPRCLSNTLRFHLSSSSSSSPDSYYNIVTTPRLLSSPEVPPKESDLEGTFQSTPTLEIRWAKATETRLLDASTSSSAGGRSKMVTVRESSSKLSYTVLEPSPEAGTAMEVQLEYQSSTSIHFAGAESSVFLDLQLDLPTSQSFEWIELPFATTNIGLASFELLGSSPQQDDPDTSTTSTVQSPPSPSPPNRSPSYLSNLSKQNPASTSQLSLLRQQLPSMNETSDLSFAFDQSGSPSPGTSPSIRHRSPLSRNNTATTPDHRTSRRIRLHLDISKIQQHRAHEPFTITLQGSLRLGQQQNQPGEVVLPFVSISGEESSTTCLVTVNSSAFPQAQVLAPQLSEPVRESSSSSRSKPSSAGDRWALVLPPTSDSQPSIDDDSHHFKLILPPPPPTPAPLPPSPSFKTIKARRQSTTFSFHPAQNLFSGSAAGDIQSKGWDQDRALGGSHAGDAAMFETIPKVEVEVVLVPRRPSPSSEVIDASKKGKSNSKGSSATPVEWDQLTKMRLLLPPRSPLLAQDDVEEEEDEDTFEFGVIATGSTSPPTLRVLSASIDSRSVAFEIQERDNGEEAEEAPGVVGYVRLFGEEGMRERGGEVEVCFVLEGGQGDGASVDGTSSKLWKAKPKGKEVVLGLPSFEAVVGWEEIKVSVGGEFALSPLVSSSSTISTFTSSTFRTLSHTLPALHAPHQRVLLLPTFLDSPSSTSSSRASFFSPSNLPLIILSFLLLSMGTEVRILRSGLVDMVLSIQSEAFATREAVGRCDAAVQAFNSRPLVQHHNPPSPSNPSTPSFTTSIDSEGNTILLPSFTDLPHPPPSHQHQRPASQSHHGEGGRGGAEIGRPASSYTIVTTLNDLLGRNLIGRGVKRVGGGIWKLLSYLITN